MSSAELSIGEVARRAGKRASAIRYYESVGLIPEPRRVSGRRRFPAETVRRLEVIETSQRAGLSLDEIGLLLDAPPATERLRELAGRKLPELREAIARAELVRDWLEHASRCECPTLDECPLFDEPSGLAERAPQL
jgi:MerR family redox-sensitive transcriptional activator SoxR